MALRRSKRSIEVFDIALMAVVTKAMGAFLVLMLIMLPSFNNLPAMEQTVANADGKRQQLAAKVEALQRRNAELKSGGSEEARLEEKRKALEEENRQLREGITSLILTFSWADCQADRFNFYAQGENVKLPDGADWPPVQRGPQLAPPGVVQYGTSSAKTLFDMADKASGAIEDTHSSLPHESLLTLFTGFLGIIIEPSAQLKPILAALDERSKKQMLWAIDNIRPNARFAIYAQPGNLQSACRTHMGGLITSMGTIARADPRWGTWLVPPAQSNRVLYLGHVAWTGNELQLINATEADQAALDKQLGLR